MTMNIYWLQQIELIAQLKDAQRICKRVNKRMDEYFEAVRATIPSKAEH